MAAAMAAKINAMLMAKGKLLTPPPLLAKVCMMEIVVENNCITFLVYGILRGLIVSLSPHISFRPLQACLFQPLQKKW